MHAERFPALVAVEKRWKDPERQRRRNEQRITFQRRDDDVAQFPRFGAGVHNLAVSLDGARLMAGGYSAIHPRGTFHYFVKMRQLFSVQYIWQCDDHEGVLRNWRSRCQRRCVRRLARRGRDGWPRRRTHWSYSMH